MTDDEFYAAAGDPVVFAATVGDGDTQADIDIVGRLIVDDGYETTPHADVDWDEVAPRSWPAIDSVTVPDLLLAYSEWLDAEQLFDVPDDDARTHTDLVTEFVTTLDPDSPIGRLVQTSTRDDGLTPGSAGWRQLREGNWPPRTRDGDFGERMAGQWDAATVKVTDPTALGTWLAANFGNSAMYRYRTHGWLVAELELRDHQLATARQQLEDERARGRAETLATHAHAAVLAIERMRAAARAGRKMVRIDDVLDYVDNYIDQAEHEEDTP